MQRAFFTFSAFLLFALSSCSLLKDEKENYNAVLLNRTLFRVDSLEAPLRVNTHCGTGAFKLVFRPDSVYMSHSHDLTKGTWYSIQSLSYNGSYQKLELYSSVSGKIQLKISYSNIYTINMENEGLGHFVDSLEEGELFTRYQDPSCQKEDEAPETGFYGQIKHLLQSANTPLKSLPEQDWDINIDYPEDGILNIKAFVKESDAVLGNFTYNRETRSLKQRPNMQELSFDAQHAEKAERSLGITPGISKTNCFPDSADVSLPFEGKNSELPKYARNLTCAFNALEKFRCANDPIEYYLIPAREGFTYAVFPEACGDSEFNTLVSIKEGKVTDMLLIYRVQETEIEEKMGLLYTDFSIDAQYNIHLRHGISKGGYAERDITSEEDFFLNEDGKFEKR